MTYDPNLMPQNMDEWNELIEFKVNEAKAAYAAAVAQARAKAAEAYAALPDTDDKPSLEQYAAQVVAFIPQPFSRDDFEQLYACYRPSEFPD